MRSSLGIVGLVAVLALVAGCGGQPAADDDAAAPATTPAATSKADDTDWRWVAVRDVEVQAPADWPDDYPAARPDCIVGGGPQDPWARDVPDRPHVVVGEPNRPVPAIGCSPARTPDSPPAAFGPLPFDLWQLTRKTIGDVLISVLAPPDRPDLATHVLDSARRVEVTALGCEVASPVQSAEHVAPTGTVPEPEDVEAVAICEYSRAGNPPVRPGLEGSRRVTGPAARALTRAIHDAPRGGGPDRPRHCLATTYGDRGIALRFLGPGEELAGEAYAYYYWCFGNGIVDAEGPRRLTRASCAPLFAEPPVSYWSGQAPVARLCGTFDRR